MKKSKELPPLPPGFEYRLDLRHHVIPRSLKQMPVHRWFWFPHSFSPQLIDEVIKSFPIPENSKILDPFVGAGTTVLRAGQLGYAATGVDLSPLSVFVSRVKLRHWSKQDLEKALCFLLKNYTPVDTWEPLPPRLQKAFSQQELSHLIGIRQKIEQLPVSLWDFFRLALLRVLQQVSRAVPDGGWFRWVQKKDQSDSIADLFRLQADQQIADLGQVTADLSTQVFQDDARRLEKVSEEFDMVVTSPPYPNRHDYSRIFHIELLSLGLQEQEIDRFRRESLRSHVEARPPNIQATGYIIPLRLEHVLDSLPDNTDTRIELLLRGYFEDVYLTFKALNNHLKTGAVCAFVVGNVRHAGVMVSVDEILPQIGAQVGFSFEKAWVARLRGNSAQQMGRFGREAARESIVFLRKC